MVIKSYEADEFYQLTNLYKVPSLFGGTYDESRDTMEKLQATSDEGSLYVAVDDIGIVVGSVMFLKNAHSFWLLRFVLDNHHDEYEKAGEMLIELAERVAKIDGHDSIIVYSSPMYEELEARYKKYNFKKANDYTCFWKEISK